MALKKAGLRILSSYLQFNKISWLFFVFLAIMQSWMRLINHWAPLNRTSQIMFSSKLGSPNKKFCVHVGQLIVSSKIWFLRICSIFRFLNLNCNFEKCSDTKLLNTSPRRHSAALSTNEIPHWRPIGWEQN